MSPEIIFSFLYRCNLNSLHYMYVCLGEKLRELLKKHGSFKELELSLTKYRNKAEKEGRNGRWVTRTMLIEHYKYTKYLG